MRESQIVFEKGEIAVYRVKPNRFEVVRAGATHAEVDSAYDTLDLALARAGYIANGRAPRSRDGAPDVRAGAGALLVSDLAIGDAFTTAHGLHGVVIGWYKDRPGEVAIVRLGERGYETTLIGPATVLRGRVLGWLA